MPRTSPNPAKISLRTGGYISLFSPLGAPRGGRRVLAPRLPLIAPQLLVVVAVLGIGGTAALQMGLASQGSTSLWAETSLQPAIVDTEDDNPIELGMKFTSEKPGAIIGVSFYKARSNTGIHTATLWTAAGTKLTSATFTNETRDGWQTVKFATPVTIQPGQVYVASYHTSVGHYSVTSNYFTGRSYDRGPLHVPAAQAGDPNGLFTYGAGFPKGSSLNANYWVDVQFVAAGNAPAKR